MDADNWTPARGWGTACLQVPIRSAIAMGLSLLAAYGLHALITALEGQAGVEISTIGWSVLFLFVVAAGAAIANAAAPDWTRVWWWLFFLCGVISVGWTARALLSD